MQPEGGQARNLEALTPPWLGFEVLTPAPIAMERGTLSDTLDPMALKSAEAAPGDDGKPAK